MCVCVCVCIPLFSLLDKEGLQDKYQEMAILFQLIPYYLLKTQKPEKGLTHNTTHSKNKNEQRQEVYINNPRQIVQQNLSIDLYC